jgi:hypothetical protein
MWEITPKGSPGFQSAEQYTSPNGYFTVQGHGDSGHIYGPDGKEISPEALAERIKHDENYTPGQGVELISCETGKGENSFAQQLAKALGDTVYAPDNIVHVVTTTNTILGIVSSHEYNLQVDNGGSYHPFVPRR